MSAFNGAVFPLTNERIATICDPKEYGNKRKYPYINFLPLTKPSKEFLEFAKKVLSNKQTVKENCSNTKALRAFYEDENTINLHEPDACDIEEFNINNQFDNNTVNGHKIRYKGANISNGAIIGVHGGCYCFLSHRVYFGSAELISKLTGCVVFLLNYKLAPEFPLPNAVNELIILYDYLLNELKISSQLISMTGGSCGGGMILLALQSIKYGAKKDLNLPQPSCVILNSAWTNLENNTCSFEKNINNAIMADVTLMNMTADWAVGNRDNDGNIINNKDKSDAIYSPINGKFDGLSPMYFSVAANELLLDDSLICARKAYLAKVNVQLDIEPFLMHIYPDLVGVYPESLIAHSRMARWILMHFQKYKKKSKL